MDYCVPLGIPHSQFLSWTEEDQDKAIAWQQTQRSFCRECGTPIHEWVDDEGLPVSPPPYVVETLYCHGCATVKAERTQITAEAEDRADSVKMFLTRNPDARTFKPTDEDDLDNVR